MAFPPMPADDLLPKEIKCELENINGLSEEEITAKLSDCCEFTYAADADEQATPNPRAHKFFYEINVLPTQRLVRLVKEAVVKNGQDVTAPKLVCRAHEVVRGWVTSQDVTAPKPLAQNLLCKGDGYPAWTC